MPTLAEAQCRLAEYRAAESAVLKMQEYTVSDGVIHRRFRRADLEQIRAAIKDLEAQVAALTPAAAGGGRRIYYGVPRR